jgi:proteasome lid subunit RPN8/RPN11
MLRIPSGIHDELIRHAKEGFPCEVCGILGGNEGNVSAIYRMTNTDASSEHFSMEPREQFAVVKDMRTKGITMQAIYHSHPETPARPSEEDIRLALTPGVSTVIVSLADPNAVSIGSFRIEEGNVSAEPIEII